MFRTELLNKDKIARSSILALTSIAAVAVPVASMFYKMDSNAGKDVVGRPPGWVFAVTWFLISVFIVFIGTVAALHVTSLPYLSLLCLVIVLISILCVLWLYVYTKQENNAIPVQVLASLIFMTTILSNLILTSPVNTREATTAMLLPASLITFWTIFATMLNLQEAGQK